MGIEGGNYNNEHVDLHSDGDQAEHRGPGLFDTQELPEIQLEDGGENAGAGSQCDIESMLNSAKKELGLQEFDDPDCNQEGLEEELGKQLDELGS